jgi:hypothetical protein
MGILQKSFDDAFLTAVRDQAFEQLWKHISAQGLELDDGSSTASRSSPRNSQSRGIAQVPSRTTWKK